MAHAYREWLLSTLCFGNTGMKFLQSQFLSKFPTVQPTWSYPLFKELFLGHSPRF
jgi:hypothetical protein